MFCSCFYHYQKIRMHGLAFIQKKIGRQGKNWYAQIDGCIITVNASSYTIITAHKEK